MNVSHSGNTKVTVMGRRTDPADDAALASLCAAVERAVQANRPAGLTVREVVVTLEDAASLPAPHEAAAAYVDVYDSGYGHGI